VEVRREQQELGVVELELAAGFVDPAFAEEHDLPAGLEGAADCRPFLQRHLK
jgi:hypothetical protein